MIQSQTIFGRWEPDFKKALEGGSAEVVHDKTWNIPERAEPTRNEPKPPIPIKKPSYFLKFK